MTHLCFDAFTPGNHEFDDGDAGLARFLKAMQTETDASATCEDMPAVLGANIVPHADSPLLATDVPSIGDHALFTMSDGEQVGVIGINVARKTMESSQPDKGTILLDEIETTKAQVEELTAMGVNKIIVVTHIGFEYDQEWIASIEGVDVVVGGDSHSLLGSDQTEAVATPRGSYATIIEKPDGGTTCVVQAWDYSKLIGNLDVDFDDNGNVVSCVGSPVFPFNPDKITVRDADPRYDMSAEDAAAMIASLVERTGGQAKAFAKDPVTALDLDAYSLQVDELTKEVVGVASETIGLEGGGFESGACDLVAQAFLLQPLSSADVAIQNRGGCRSSIEEGDFTINDAYTLLPFSNTMVNIVMTGEQIKNVLEDAIDFYLDPSGSSGAYPRASGLRFDVSEGEAKGSRVTNLEVNAKLAGEWEPINDSASYTVVTNNFIVTPRDGYYEFGNIADELKVDTYVEYAQSFIDYAKSVDSFDPVPEDLSSTQTWIGAATEAPTTSPTKLPTEEMPEKEEEMEDEEKDTLESASGVLYLGLTAFTGCLVVVVGTALLL
mmetsp:Transcript_6194/g.15331  ORF Transcript_6194/g.15331 Transcript_6194/m.15331 type:complete len:551 (+) Transcript_6194:385-2037(+)